MSYQVLARKWRPQQFRDMIGQEHVLKALVNALESNRLHHAYLFTGMRGVGKTTIARIFAKCLNCERVENVTAEPCGECPTCLDIEAGRFFDLIEVDAASRTKVDETRELLENVPYAPTSGRYKVYLIDEVHMFSNHSFNALLKTLEEPPSHVKFLLATTDPQKVPVTVLSRCLQFNLKRMVPARLADYLEKILSEESIANERRALDLIARAADGSVRDSLSLVEQAAAYGEGTVKLLDVESMLGRVSIARLLDVLDALAEHNVDQLFTRINELSQYAPDFHDLLGELLSLTHRIAMLQSVPGSVESEATERDQLQALADKISTEEIQLWYQIGMHARRDMPYAPDLREAFDMAMLRMLAFAPQGAAAPIPTGAINNSTAKPSESNPVVESASTVSPEAVSPKTVTTEAVTTETVTTEAVSPKAAAPELMSSDAYRQAALNAALGKGPAVAPVVIPSEPSEPSEPTESKKKRSDSVKQVIDTEAVKYREGLELTNEHWPEIVRALQLDGLALQLAMNSAVGAWENDRLTLRLPKRVQNVNQAAVVEQVATAVGKYCSTSADSGVKIVVEATSDALVTPVSLLEIAKRKAQQDAERSIENDSLLAELLVRVDGEVTKNSVRPIKAVDSIDSIDYFD